MSDSFIQHFDQYWEAEIAPLLPAGPFIVAVSGGVDSIVLADILAGKKRDFILAHCNFHLRGEESDRDQHFVEAFATHIDRRLLVKDFDTVAYAKTRKIGIEEAARQLRYDWFRELAVQSGTGKFPSPILVAHHANDSIETLLINFFRGCGIAGVHGILPVHEGIFRPLLFATRKDIIRYALARKLRWVEDSTNKDSNYLRNFFRNELLPELKVHIPTVENNLLENIQRFREVESVYCQYFEGLRQQWVEPCTQGYRIALNRLEDCQPLATTLLELFRPFGFTSRQTDEIRRLLKAETGARLLSDTHILYKDREYLLITAISQEEETYVLWHETDKEVFLSERQRIVAGDMQDKASGNHVLLDKSRLKFPLVLRHWKAGDYFCPNGMAGKKKLAKYFIDQKIPVPQKDRIWLLISEGQIVWILGYRADRRFTAEASASSPYPLSFIEK